MDTTHIDKELDRKAYMFHNVLPPPSLPVGLITGQAAMRRSDHPQPAKEETATKAKGRALRGPAHLQSLLIPKLRVGRWPVALRSACHSREVPQHNPQKNEIHCNDSRLHAWIAQHETPPSAISMPGPELQGETKDLLRLS
jgi:hypothetical protein